MSQKRYTVLCNEDILEVEYLQTSKMDYCDVICDDEDLLCPYCGNIIEIRPYSLDTSLDSDDNVIHSCETLLKLSKLYEEETKTIKKYDDIKNKIIELKNNVKAIQFEDNIFWNK